MFQIIEIVSKMIYIPVRFSGLIKEVLEAIVDLSDPIDIPSDLIMDGKLEDSHSSYKGKIFDYGEFGNVLQSMPISSTLFMAIELTLVSISLISVNLNDTFKKAKWNKIGLIFSNLQLSFIESSIIDLQFYSMLNIIIYPKLTTKNIWNTVSFIIAIYILLSLVYKYVSGFHKVSQIIKSQSTQKATKIAKNMPDIMIELSFDGLKYHNSIDKIKDGDCDKMPSKKIIKHLSIAINFNIFFRF